MIHYRCQAIEPGRKDATVVDVWAESQEEVLAKLNARGLLAHSVTVVEEMSGPQPDWRSEEYRQAMARIATRSLVRVIGGMMLGAGLGVILFKTLAALILVPVLVWITCEVVWFVRTPSKVPHGGA